MPDLVIDIIQSFHDSMKAKVRINGELLEEIDVKNGQRQGCIIAPALVSGAVVISNCCHGGSLSIAIIMYSTIRPEAV